MFVDTDKIELGSKDKSRYQSVIGLLIYIAQKMWPDIATAASILGQFALKPWLVHLKAALQVVCYLKDTWTLGPCRSPKSDNQVTYFANADWAEYCMEQKLTSGFVCMFAGAPITCLQEAAKLTMAAKLIAASFLR